MFALPRFQVNLLLKRYGFSTDYEIAFQGAARQAVLCIIMLYSSLKRHFLLCALVAIALGRT